VPLCPQSHHRWGECGVGRHQSGYHRPSDARLLPPLRDRSRGAMLRAPTAPAMPVTMTRCHFRQVSTFAGVALHAHAEVGSEPDVRRMAATALLAAGMQHGRVRRMRSERVPLPFSSRSGGRKKAQNGRARFTVGPGTLLQLLGTSTPSLHTAPRAQAAAQPASARLSRHLLRWRLVSAVRPLTALSTSVITVGAFWKVERCESRQTARADGTPGHTRRLPVHRAVVRRR
jgi:hypothetical protein